MTLQEQHQLALDRFRLVETVDGEQNRLELEDLAFDAGDQWTDDAKEARGGTPQNGNTPAVPPRPMPVIRSLDQPIAQVINQARNARMAVKISPRSDGADQFTADVIGGIIRSIEYESRAQSVYLGVGAYQRAVIAGRGAAVIEKEYASDEPGEWDQVLRIRGVANGASVYLDPWTEDVNDPAGPRWGFRTKDYPADVYKAEFGATALAEADTDSILTSIADPKNSWIKTDAKGQPIYRVAEYWFVEEDRSTEAHPDLEGVTREVTDRKVYWAKLNGVEFIDPPQEWDGQFIPLPRVIGVEKNVGGKRSWEGMIRPNIGPCRMINFAAATVMENMGLSTRGKWIGYTGQFEGIDKWETANTRNWSFLEANATTDDTGQQILSLPQWSQADPGIEPAINCVNLFTTFVRSTSGVPDAALGNVNPSDRSGSAIKQLQQASEQGTSNYPDHLRRFIEQTGHILLDLIPKIYDRPGRIVHIMTGQTDEQSQVMLGQPYVLDQQGVPRPVMAPNGEAIMDPALASQLTQGQSKFVDLNKGKYSVVVETGKSFATRRQEAVSAMTDLAAAAPELLPRYADLLVKAMDIPESEAIAERLAPPGVGNQNLPPQAQAMITQLQQQLQQAQQEIQTKQAQIAAKGQIDLQIAREKNVTDLERERMKDVATMTVGSWKVDAENTRSYFDAEIARIAHDEGFRLHLAKAATDYISQVHANSHDTMTMALEHRHEADMADKEAQHQQALASQTAQHQQQLAATTAALQPQPDQAS